MINTTVCHKPSAEIRFRLSSLRASGAGFVLLASEHGYGERDESRVIQAPTQDLPPNLRCGTTLQVQPPNGGVVPLTVVAIDGRTTTLDGNHPPAGKTRSSGGS